MRWCSEIPVDQTQLLIPIATLIAVEIVHLKWIWWTHWHCRKCSRKNRDCECESRKWLLYL